MPCYWAQPLTAAAVEVLLRYNLNLPLFKRGSVIKGLYNHFSSSAKRVQWKDVFEEEEYTTLYKNVPTRWLSLWPTVKRLHDSWPAVKSDFLSLGEERCPSAIWKLLAIGWCFCKIASKSFPTPYLTLRETRQLCVSFSSWWPILNWNMRKGKSIDSLDWRQALSYNSFLMHRPLL